MRVRVCLQVWRSSLPLQRLSWGPGPPWMATSPMMTHMMKTTCLRMSPPHRAQVSTHTDTKSLNHIYFLHIVPFLPNTLLHTLFLTPPLHCLCVFHCPSALVFILSRHFFFGSLVQFDIPPACLISFPLQQRQCLCEDAVWAGYKYTECIWPRQCVRACSCSPQLSSWLHQ